MTASEGRREEKRRVRMLRGFGARIDKLLAPLWLISIPLFAIFLSHKAGEYALSGMATAVISVLPTTFPSMLLCDIYRAYGHPERITPLGCLFSFLFGISPAGLRALLLGNLCGFPMGAREVTECYKAGGLSKREAERLLPLTMNPSPPFVVGAVGMSMLGGIGEGVLLLLCLMLSTVAVGIIFRERRDNKEISNVICEQKYNFVESVKDAAESSITVIAFISCFSVLLGFAGEFIKPLLLRSAIFAVLEVTGGVNFFSALEVISPSLRGAAVAFTLGFGGLSVMLQGAAFLSDGLTLRAYIPTKLWQGVICALCYTLLRSFFI